MEFIAKMNNSIDVTEQNLQIRQGFSQFLKMQKTLDLSMIFFIEKSGVFLHFLGLDNRRRAARRCPDANTALQVPKSLGMPSNHSEAQKSSNRSVFK